MTRCAHLERRGGVPVVVVDVADWLDASTAPGVADVLGRALDEDVARTVTSVLRGNVDGPWSRTGARASTGRPTAGKTGSTNGSKAAWFAGYTGTLAGSLWVGTPVPTELRGVRIDGRYYRQVYGGTLPAPVWGRIMTEVHEGAPVVPLPPAVRPAPVPRQEPREERRDRRDRDDRSDRDDVDTLASG